LENDFLQALKVGSAFEAILKFGDPTDSLGCEKRRKKVRIIGREEF